MKQISDTPTKTVIHVYQCISPGNLVLKFNIYGYVGGNSEMYRFTDGIASSSIPLARNIAAIESRLPSLVGCQYSADKLYRESTRVERHIRLELSESQIGSFEDTVKQHL